MNSPHEPTSTPSKFNGAETWPPPPWAADPPCQAAPTPAGALRQVPGLRLGDRPRSRTTAEDVACEAPVELRINGRSQVILMASPVQLQELALGYCLSEGLVRRPEQVEGMSLGQAELPAVGLAHWVDISLGPELARRAKVRRLAPAATSCSLCGLQSFKELPTDLAPVVDSALVVTLESLFGLLGAMEAGQGVFIRSGGTHAAALGTAEGRLISMAEDIGRHNALDKAVGLAWRGQGFDPAASLAILSGRLSYEMALKVARLGIPVVASVSAPTSLCVDLLQGLNITLVAFCRPPRATVYTHSGRIIAP